MNNYPNPNGPNWKQEWDVDWSGLIVCLIVVFMFIGIVIAYITIGHPDPKEVKTIQNIDCNKLKSHIQDLILQDKPNDEYRAIDLYHWKCEK